MDSELLEDRPTDMDEVERHFTDITWMPQAGSQTYWLTCNVFEALYEGTRGPGKTDGLLMDFIQFVGMGYGAEWRGVLFRRTYPELEDVMNKAHKWFPLVRPGCWYNKVDRCWTFPHGEKLYFRHMHDPKDYYKYHGHSYPWIGWEELTTWPDAKCYLPMMSCCRSTLAGMPRRYRSTTNPYGVGHNWVKKRWRLPGARGKVIKDDMRDDGSPAPPRVAIHGRIQENLLLLKADPDYVGRIMEAAENPQQAKAWLEGDWDIVAGGMFDDVWDQRVHVVPPFDVPRDWLIDRAYDWGSSKPFSIGWYAESDGCDIQLGDGTWMSTMPGDLFRIHEWYGWNGRDENVGTRLLAHDIAKGIVERELAWGIYNRVVPGPADTSIFTSSATETGISIADEMQQAVQLNGEWFRGAAFDRADKSPGSRKAGWQNIRKRLKAAHRPKGGAREHAGLFVFAGCNDQFLRTFPVLPRDDKDLDDVNTEAEDHIGDEVRYRCHNPPRVYRSLEMR